MPQLRGDYDLLRGPCLQIAIQNPEWDARWENRVNRLTALFDTGASHTSVSQQIIDLLAVLPTGITLISGVTGTADVYTYDVRLLLTSTDQQRFAHTLRVPTFDSSSLGVDVLIGRDILSNGTFIMDNASFFTFTWHLP